MKATAASWCSIIIQEGLEIDHTQIIVTTGGSEAILLVLWPAWMPAMK